MAVNKAREARKEKLAKFIKENDISFEGDGSGLNFCYTVISGYALFLRVKSVKEIEEVIKKEQPHNDVHFGDLEYVFNFARRSRYGDWWTSKEATSSYKYEI